MRRLHFWTLAALLPAAILLASVGCNGKSGDKDKDKPAADSATKDKDDDGMKKPVVIKTRGTLKGKVTLPSPPGNLDEKTAELQTFMKKHQNGAKCMEGTKDEISQQAYRIGEGNGLADVFVWLAPPDDNHYYQLDPKVDLELRDVKPGVVDVKAKEVVLDQPHCAFIPYAFALFPRYNDGKGMKPTGQKLIVKNSADFQHNTNWKGGPRNPGDNKTVPAKSQLEVPPLNPDRIPVMFKCDIHTWMQAASRVFDHPFVAVTDKDGVFTIEGAPAGVDLQVVAWHPNAGFLNGDKGEKITLEDGMTETKNFEAKAK